MISFSGLCWYKIMFIWKTEGGGGGGGRGLNISLLTKNSSLKQKQFILNVYLLDSFSFWCWKAAVY